ncbi:hypothetical protein CEP54_010285 [Fusarium duplospermum]|uniref:Uncharacterized protein n=1 Tax=Fusarium duplospermum TaxID=1325734 RepID=A0A428PKS9_9HYPO|nr:hypothetical protein CEP54_010285 [Fusarium duplospermum]
MSIEALSHAVERGLNRHAHYASLAEFLSGYQELTLPARGLRLEPKTMEYGPLPYLNATVEMPLRVGSGRGNNADKEDTNAT